jgi:ketosteroid isomerase-like protein
MKVLRQFIDLSDRTIRLQVHDVVADEGHAVALFTVRAERLGRKLEDRSVQVFHIHGGKATEAWVYPGNLYAWDEFWS